MIRENALGKKNSCYCVGLRYIGKFLMPIVSVCCMQAWAEDEPVFSLESASGETKTVAESGTYTASQDLTFGALQVAASPVTFDFSETPSRKVVFDGSSATAFLVNKKRANVTFKRGEWSVAEGSDSLFQCSNKEAYETKVFMDSCVWTNLNSVYVGRNASRCTLTLDNNSRIYSKGFRLVNGGSGYCALNVLGGSGLFLSSTDTPFRTDTNSSDGGNGTITVAGDGSILSAPNSEFRFGYHAADQFLVVSNNASLVANNLYIGKNATAERARVLVADNASVTAANIYMHSINGNMIISNNAEVTAGTFDIGRDDSSDAIDAGVLITDASTLTAKEITIRNPGCGMTVSNNAEVTAGKLDIGRDDSSDAVGANVLITDGSTLTAKEITIRNPGCGMTVSNATLTVDSTAVDAIKVGYAGRTGGSFVLSGASAQIVYVPEGSVEVFAPDSGNAEFCIEDGASWNVTGNQIAAKTSNSVFRIASGGKFIVNESTKMHFGPAANNNGDPATSLSNRLEVCDGGSLEIKGLRFSGHGNMLVVSNGCVSSTDTIQIGYRRAGWANGLNSKDCAIVFQGRRGRLDAPDNVLQVQNGSVVRFVIPEDGYENGIVPLKLRGLSFDSTSNARLDIDCEAFMAKGGGKVTLAKVGKDGFEGAEKAFTAFKETLPPGYDLTWENNTLVFRCPRNRFVFSIR